MPWRVKVYRPIHLRTAANNERTTPHRASAAKRGYGRRWRKLRLIILRRDPICMSSGCERPSEEVDHIVPRAQGGADSGANLQGLCKTHHSRKTAREDGGFGRAPRMQTRSTKPTGGVT